MNIKTLDFGLKIKEVSEAGIFSGYGSVFDVIDSYNEIVMPGAFKASLERHAANGTMPAQLWQHRSAEPTGVFTNMVEDERGLLLEGQLALKVQRGAEAHELMKMKAVNGLSIGFVPVEEEVDHKTGVRRITKLDLWEVSIVTFPANQAATIHGVKSFDEIQDIRSLERHIRDVYGLTQREAVALIAKAKSLSQSESSEDEFKALAAALQLRNFT